MSNQEKSKLFREIVEKGSLKQKVYANTLAIFNLIKEVIHELEDDYGRPGKIDSENVIPFEAVESGEFEVHLKFAGDILIFCMHTNVFEFPRNHEVMKTSYIRDDKHRSYCGIINIYNFLADSFKYNRSNDIGYLIGRVFVNKDKSYFIEGKRELGMLYPNFGKEKLDRRGVYNIVSSAIRYTLNFDLLTPPYDSQVQVSVNEMRSMINSFTLKTGKRLGFRFQADED
jgi:hypothetical protein